MALSEHEMSDLLQRLVDTAGEGLLEDTDAEADELHGCHTRDYDSTMVLTMNAGFVMTLASGEIFQITVVRSR